MHLKTHFSCYKWNRSVGDGHPHHKVELESYRWWCCGSCGGHLSQFLKGVSNRNIIFFFLFFGKRSRLYSNEEKCIRNASISRSVFFDFNFNVHKWVADNVPFAELVLIFKILEQVWQRKMNQGMLYTGKWTSKSSTLFLLFCWTRKYFGWISR